jgi:HD-like signal output (HDOD) protein
MLRTLLVSGELELPVLPEVSAKLLRISNDPNCEANALADLIRRDPSVASHLMRIANSAMYSAGSPIVSLQQAVARLGLRRIREIVMIISCQNRVFDVTGFETEIRKSFRRSLGAAIFGQEIARIRRINVEEAFLCGLLHDVGRPVLLQSLVDLQKEHETDFEAADMIAAVEEFRVRVSGDLIEEWKLPARVANAIRCQETDEAVLGGNQEAHVLKFAIDLARITLEQDDTADETADNRVCRHCMIPVLNLYPDQVELLLGKRDEVRDWVNNSV